MSSTCRITLHEGADPEIDAASVEARKSFRLFWKQVALDFNRVVKALEMACIKRTFRDDATDPDTPAEHMWISDVDFDGSKIRGQLINSPQWLKSVRQGDIVEFTVSEIADWICVLGGQVYGAYTVQIIRSRMTEAERASYDGSWGLNFPPPNEVRLPPEYDEFEAVVAPLLEQELQRNPALANAPYESGRTLLHLESLYGREQSVRILLAHGADSFIRCNRGWTARDYAACLHWTGIMDLLDQAAGTPGR